MTEKGKKRTVVTSSMLEFVEESILGITDLTRSNKLSEILDSFSGKVSSHVYVVQNKNKPSKAVIADLEYFKLLLEYKEAVEDAIDRYMFGIALERKDDVANIPLAQVLEGENFDLDEILSLAENIEVDEDWWGYRMI